MADWFSRFTGKTSSALEAKERLKLVLIHDRTDLTPDLISRLKDDVLAAISKHVQIDPSQVKISMSHEGREQRLIADIPLKPNQRRKIG